MGSQMNEDPTGSEEKNNGKYIEELNTDGEIHKENEMWGGRKKTKYTFV